MTRHLMTNLTTSWSHIYGMGFVLVYIYINGAGDCGAVGWSWLEDEMLDGLILAKPKVVISRVLIRDIKESR